MTAGTYGRVGHLVVAARLREAILSGRYAPGSRLPSEGFIAAELGCGRDTVRDAFAVLRRELLIVTERGFRAVVPLAPARRTVPLPAGATVTARMPLHPELAVLGCRPEMPLLEVAVGDSAPLRFPADQVALVVA